MDRKDIFDAVRRLLGRGFRQAEVEALDAAIELARTYKDTRWALVVVTGSLYLVGDVKRLLRSQI